MGNDIKGEFKEFISTLSTEICKQVLLEELKGINNSFEKIEKDYKILYDNYTKNINSIKGQLTQLQSTNQKLGEFIININNNNNKINKAMDIINGEHKVITDKIIKENDKLFSEYSVKIKSLNIAERNKFITELTSSINLYSKKYISELESIVNGSKFENVEKVLTLTSNKINSVDNNINSMAKRVNDLEKLIITSVENTALENEKKLTYKIQTTNAKVDIISNEFKNTIEELSSKTDKNNKIIMILISVIIVLCIVLIFRT